MTRSTRSSGAGFPPYWIDTVGKSSLVEVRVKSGRDVIRVVARRSQAYASNSHIFLMWMVGTSLVLLTIAVSLPAKPDQAHPHAGRCGRGLRQGPRG